MKNFTCLIVLALTLACRLYGLDVDRAAPVASTPWSFIETDSVVTVKGQDFLGQERRPSHRFTSGLFQITIARADKSQPHFFVIDTTPAKGAWETIRVGIDKVDGFVAQVRHANDLDVAREKLSTEGLRGLLTKMLRTWLEPSEAQRAVMDYGLSVYTNGNLRMLHHMHALPDLARLKLGPPIAKYPNLVTCVLSPTDQDHEHVACFRRNPDAPIFGSINYRDRTPLTDVIVHPSLNVGEGMFDLFAPVAHMKGFNPLVHFNGEGPTLAPLRPGAVYYGYLEKDEKGNWRWDGMTAELLAKEYIKAGMAPAPAKEFAREMMANLDLLPRNSGLHPLDENGGKFLSLRIFTARKVHLYRYSSSAYGGPLEILGGDEKPDARPIAVAADARLRDPYRQGAFFLPDNGQFLYFRDPAGKWQGFPEESAGRYESMTGKKSEADCRYYQRYEDREVQLFAVEANREVID